MTDEQLSGLIDFSAKLNIILQQRYEATDPKNQNISKETAERTSRRFIETLYKVDLSTMNCHSNFYTADLIGGNRWGIAYEPLNKKFLNEQQKLYWIYLVNVDSDTGNIIFVESFNSNISKESKIVNNLSPEEKEQFIDHSRSVLNDAGIHESSLREELIYIPALEEKSVCVIFKTIKDEFYGIELSYPDQMLIGYHYYPDEKTMRENVDKYAKIVLLDR